MLQAQLAQWTSWDWSSIIAIRQHTVSKPAMSTFSPIIDRWTRDSHAWKVSRRRRRQLKTQSRLEGWDLTARLAGVPVVLSLPHKLTYRSTERLSNIDPRRRQRTKRKDWRRWCSSSSRVVFELTWLRSGTRMDGFSPPRLVPSCPSRWRRSEPSR